MFGEQTFAQLRTGFTATETVGLLGTGAQDVHHIVQELCESRGGRPGLYVLNDEPHGFRGRKATLNHAHALVSACP